MVDKYYFVGTKNLLSALCNNLKCEALTVYFMRLFQYFIIFFSFDWIYAIIPTIFVCMYLYWDGNPLSSSSDIHSMDILFDFREGIRKETIFSI